MISTKKKKNELTDRKGMTYKVLSCDVISGGYPRLNDAGNVVYVLHPEYCEDELGRDGYFLVKVVLGGYLEPSIIDNPLPAVDEAIKWAAQLNEFNGFTIEEVETVMEWSMTGAINRKD